MDVVTSFPCHTSERNRLLKNKMLHGDLIGWRDASMQSIVRKDWNDWRVQHMSQEISLTFHQKFEFIYLRKRGINPNNFFVVHTYNLT